MNGERQKPMKLVGRIKQIWRYPVKSMVGEQLDVTRIEATGVVGDRIWAHAGLDYTRRHHVSVELLD